MRMPLAPEVAPQRERTDVVAVGGADLFCLPDSCSLPFFYCFQMFVGVDVFGPMFF